MRLPDYALSPLTYALLLALALAWSWRRLPRWGRIAGVFVEIVLLFLMAPVGANMLVWSVESRAPPARSCPAPTPTTIVLLDGGTDRRPLSPVDFAALSEPSLHRLFTAVALWRGTPNARLVISGGGTGVPHAILLRGLAERMGVPTPMIEVEDRSNTTWENAMYTSKLSPAVPRRVWLVTSALHMPRSLRAFRAWGFEPCAYPGASLYTPFSASVGYFMPQSSSLVKTEAAIHEFVGGMVYRMLEWKHRRDAAPGPSGAPAPDRRPSPSAP